MDHEQDSSSSDDHDDEKLREALDVRMFSATKSIPEKRNEHPECKTPIRLKDNLLNVTPEFQNFVAKRLSDSLDRIIEECHPEKRAIEPDRLAGIRLFSDSKTLLLDRKFLNSHNTCDTESEIPVHRSERRKRRAIRRKLAKPDPNELNEKQKCQEAAVSADWLLSGDSTSGWSRPKGEELAYRKNDDGVLEAVEFPLNIPPERYRLDQTTFPSSTNI